jgi:hypothetical protein
MHLAAEITDNSKPGSKIGIPENSPHSGMIRNYFLTGTF